MEEEREKEERCRWEKGSKMEKKRSKKEEKEKEKR